MNGAVVVRVENVPDAAIKETFHQPKKMSHPTHWRNMLIANTYAAPSATEPLVATTIERRDVGPHDVLIEIKYAGICHSDIHTVRGEWGPQQYPLTPGHEIAGIVTGIGSEVTRHKVGDRVGVGCMVNSCGECANCRRARSSTASRG